MLARLFLHPLWQIQDNIKKLNFFESVFFPFCLLFVIFFGGTDYGNCLFKQKFLFFFFLVDKNNNKKKWTNRKTRDKIFYFFFVAFFLFVFHNFIFAVDICAISVQPLGYFDAQHHKGMPFLIFFFDDFGFLQSNNQSLLIILFFFRREIFILLNFLNFGKWQSVQLLTFSRKVLGKCCAERKLSSVLLYTLTKFNGK